MLRLLVCAAVSCGLAFGQTSSSQPAITVAQLMDSLAGPAQHDSDAALARRVGSLHLVERLTPGTLARLEETLHAGAETRDALRLLADTSALLDPPPGELPHKPAPRVPEQQAMMNAAVNSVAVTMRHLPDFFATRTTQSFDNQPTVATHSGWAPTEPVHPVGIFRQAITYRDGKEVTGPSAASAKGMDRVGPPGLTSTGEFGSLLATVLRDSSHGTIAWSHWETAGADVVAVFHYAVPQAASHYEVDFCCVKSSEDPTAYNADGLANAYRGRPAYHGDLFLDPATGTITRFTVVPELKSSDPITQAGVAIDYGMVAIQGDKSYLCPVHSLALSVVESYAGGENSARLLTRINDVTFSDFHRFGSTIRVVEPSVQP
jgi:hypothetical protein